MKLVSAACENNKRPILAVLARYLDTPASVLEIGSGSGQHAVFFSSQLPHITWQPADLESSFDSINAWREEQNAGNCLPPVLLDLRQDDWIDTNADHLFTANTLHIVDLSLVQRLLAGAGKVLPLQGYLFVYGPFNYNGTYTSESNADFDQWLKNRDSESGIRDFEAIDRLAEKAGLLLVEDVAMPANNRMLVYQKTKRPD